MAFDAHANFAYGTVLIAPSPGDTGTSLVLAPGAAALMPAVPFNAVVWPTGVAPLAKNAEIVRVTNISANTLTITRAQEGTAARTIQDGDQFANAITNKVFTDIEGAFTSGFPDGTVGAPGMFFTNHPQIGFYISGGVSLGVGVAGTNVLLFSTGQTASPNDFWMQGKTRFTGAVICDVNALGAQVIDQGKILNQATVAVDTAFTFLIATPLTAGTTFALLLNNTDVAAHTITIPSSFSYALGGARTTFTLGAGQTVLLQWNYYSSTYYLSGDPVLVTDLAAAGVLNTSGLDDLVLSQSGVAKKITLADLFTALGLTMDFFGGGNITSAGIVTAVQLVSTQSALLTGCDMLEHVTIANQVTTSPTSAYGTGAGTGPSGKAVAGSDFSGTITLTTGTTPAGSGATILDITWGLSFASLAPNIILFPANAATALLSGTTQVWANSVDNTHFRLTAGTVGLTAATTYKWFYIVVGND